MASPWFGYDSNLFKSDHFLSDRICSIHGVRSFSGVSGIEPSPSPFAVGPAAFCCHWDQRISGETTWPRVPHSSHARKGRKGQACQSEIIATNEIPTPMAQPDVVMHVENVQKYEPLPFAGGKGFWAVPCPFHIDLSCCSRTNKRHILFASVACATYPQQIIDYPGNQRWQFSNLPFIVDFPVRAPINRGFPTAMIDFRRVSTIFAPLLYERLVFPTCQVRLRTVNCWFGAGPPKPPVNHWLSKLLFHEILVG